MEYNRLIWVWCHSKEKLSNKRSCLNKTSKIWSNMLLHHLLIQEPRSWLCKNYQSVITKLSQGQTKVLLQLQTNHSQKFRHKSPSLSQNNRYLSLRNQRWNQLWINKKFKKSFRFKSQNRSPKNKKKMKMMDLIIWTKKAVKMKLTHLARSIKLNK